MKTITTYTKCLSLLKALSLLMGFMVGLGNLQAQTCNYKPGAVSLSLTGQSMGSNYVSQIVLTDVNGVIQYVTSANSTVFNNVPSGSYTAIGVTYDQTVAVPNLSVGQNISTVSGCYKTTPIGIGVCDCNVTSGTLPVTLSVSQSGQTSVANQVNKYVLTDGTGKIVSIASVSNFQVNANGTYDIYAVAYDNTGVISNLVVGSNISNVTGTCVNISAGVGYVVCICPLPTAPTVVSSGSLVCPSSTVSLTASNCAGTITWNTGAIGSVLVVVSGGTYSATCTTACGTSVSTSVFVSQVLPPTTGPPTVVSSGTTVCPGQSVSLTASNCNGTITWNNNLGTMNPLSVNVAGTYFATCTNSCGTSQLSTPVVLQQGAAPAAPTVVASGTVVCPGQVITLTASNCAGTVTWNNGAIGSVLVVSNAGAGTYSATCTNSCGTSVSSVLVIIQQGVAPAAPTLVSSSPTVCPTAAATLTASNCNGTITWNTGVIGNVLTVNTAGTYSATCTNSCGTSAPSTAIAILMGCCNTPCNNITGVLSATAIGQTSVANQVNKYVLTDGTGKILSISNTGTFSGNGNGTYSIYSVSYDGSGVLNNLVVGNNISSVSGSCMSISNAVCYQVQLLSPPTVVSSGTTVCTGMPVSLTASNCNGTITWNNNLGTTNPLSVSVSGSYSATCTTSCGTSAASIPVVLQQGAAPTAPTIVSSSPTVCPTAAATLTASNCNGTVTWSTGLIGNVLTVNTAGSYSATCTNSCGTSAASTAIAILAGCCNTPCNNITGVLSATAIGQTSVAGQVNKYVLTDGTGKIVSISNSGTFSGNGNGTYSIYSVSYDGSGVLNNLVVGNNISSVSGSCMSISNAVCYQVQLLSPPTVVSSGTTVCTGMPVSLTASNCNGTITWNNNLGTTNPLSVSVSGSYSATCTTSCGTSAASIPVVLQQGTPPNPPTLTADKTSLCGNDVATLVAANCNGTITWSNGSTGSIISVNSAGTYSATCSNACGISGSSSPIQIQKGTAPNPPTLTADKTSLCGNDVATLVAANCNGTITWSNGSTGSIISVNSAGTYSATCSNACGISGSSSPIQIQKGTAPNPPTLTADKTSLCGNDVATLVAANCNGTITWSNGSTGSIISINSAGTYSATCSNACGISGNSSPIQIQKGTAPNPPTLTADKTSLCGNDVATLVAANCNGTITWSNGSTGSIISVNSAGTYSATCSNACGISGSSSPIQIQKGTAPNPPTLTADKTSLCGNDVATLVAANCNGTITWSNGSTGSIISINSAGTYSATCSNACGISGNSSPIQIQKGTAPNPPTLTADKTSLCGNDVATLVAANCNGTITWSNGSTGSIISVNSAGSYSATCSNACGISGSSSPIQIQKGTAPNPPTLTADKTSLCGNDVATLVAANCNGTITWSNGSTGSIISVNSAGTYSATCSNACGISGSSSPIQIQKGTAPNPPTLTADKTSLCGNDVATLVAANCNGTITWSNGSTGSMISVNSAGNYSATCSNACGISGSSSPIQIQKGTAPNHPTLTADKTSLCGNEVVSLTASNCSGTIMWSNGSTGSIISVNSAGSYSATCSNACGISSVCSSLVILQGGLPNAPIIQASSLVLCPSSTVTLTATGCSGTTTWITGVVGNSFSVISAGTYTATCKNACGISVNSLPVIIQSSSLPNVPIITIDKTNLCSGSSATLTASNCTGSLLWDNGATTSTIQVTTSATYGVTCSNICGSRRGILAVTITTSELATTPIITSDKTALCANDMAKLTATNCNGTIKWNTGSAGSTISTNITGSYTATCETSCGQSSSSNTIVLNQGSQPNSPVVSSNKTSCCVTEVATLMASGCDGMITWSTGATGSSLTVNTAGTYTAKCTNKCGTSGVSNAVILQTNSAPAVPTLQASNTLLCPSSSSILTASGCNGTITWSTGATGSSLTINTAGTYTAKCTNNCGMSGNSLPVVIQSGDLPSVPLISIDKTVLCSGSSATLTISNCTGSLLWDNGATTSTIQVTTSATYGVTCSNSCGSRRGVLAVTITTSPAASTPVITATKTVLCPNETTTLTASNCNGSLAWSNNMGSSLSITVSAGTYTATCSNACCDVSNSITITTSPAATTPVITAAKTVLCPNETTTLTASNCNGILAWSNNMGSSLSITVSAGTYSATCSNACCDVSNSITITTSPAASTPVITAAKTVLCPNETTTLTASNCNGSLAWSNNMGSSLSITVSAGSYTATCSNACGASPTSNTVTITTSPAASTPVITAAKTVLCPNETTTLTASNCNGSLAWSNNMGSSLSITGVSAGSYTATCSNACGVSPASNVISITNRTSGPVAPVITANKTSLCGSEQATLTASNCNGNLTWSNGATSTTVSVSSGTYSATCSNACGMSTAVSIIITSGTSPTSPVITTNKTSLCGSEQATLTASNCNGNLTWSNGATSTAITVGVGNYSAVCSISCGTSPVSNSISVTSNSISVTLRTDCGGCQITSTASVFIPEGFSPNGDGVNDTFVIKGLSGTSVESFEVYNTWGHVVYRQTSVQELSGEADELWDGKSKDSKQELPAGTYFYNIKLSNETQARIKAFTIVR